MSNAGDYRPIPATGDGNGNYNSDPCLPLLNLSTVCARMESLQQFLSVSVNNNTLIGQQQMQMVSSEIASAIHQIIVNGAALLATAAGQSSNSPSYNHETESNRTGTSNPIPFLDSTGSLFSNFGDKIVSITTNSTSLSLEKGVVDHEIEENRMGNSNPIPISGSIGSYFSKTGDEIVKFPGKIQDSTSYGLEKGAVDHEIEQNRTETSNPIPIRESIGLYLSEVGDEIVTTPAKMAMVDHEMVQNCLETLNPISIRGSIESYFSKFGDEIVTIPAKVAKSTSFGLEKGVADLKTEAIDEIENGEWEIIELDAVELLAEHVHFCEICGKGFKRDANLRMHMRAHGNQFKTPEALAKPEKCGPIQTRRRMRFSCPFGGCNRNKQHKKFRPLKSVICVKNHFKRSHCPKMYSCNRCNRKSFSVVADLKSHLKHCGESKWKCSCGTTFSRKDKLFGHMALFEGHMPAVVEEEEEKKGKEPVVMVVDDDDVEEEEEDGAVKEVELNCLDNGLFDEMLEGFGSIDNYCLQEILDSANAVDADMSDFLSF